MPDCFGKPAVTNACAFYQYTRGCGCAKHPAFPAPSLFEGHEYSIPRTLPASRDAALRLAKVHVPAQAVDLRTPSNQNRFLEGNRLRKWSEWQDSNLRPLRPERSEYFLSY